MSLSRASRFMSEPSKQEQETARIHREEVDMILLVTTLSLEGYRITDYLKMISGESVLGTGFLSEISAGFSDVFGTESESFARKIQTARNAAEYRIKEKALNINANAIVGASFTCIPFSGNVIGIFVTGTAVKIEPIKE